MTLTLELFFGAGYPEFGYLLNRTGRPMVYSCSWPFYQLAIGMKPDYGAIAHSCHLWRNFDDIQDSWSSVESIIDFCKPLLTTPEGVSFAIWTLIDEWLPQMATTKTS